MKVDVVLDEQHMLPDAYGKYADPCDQAGWASVRSFPCTVSDIPAGTRALAWIFLDWDSVPVCGFPWVHWCACLGGVEGLRTVELPDDMSRQGHAHLMQGYTSAAKNEPELATGYVGPCPPDATHVYTLHVVALDEEPTLHEPFWANELVAACRGHVQAEATALLPSRS